MGAVSAERADIRGYLGTHVRGCGRAWLETDTTRSDIKAVVSRTKERGVCGPTQGIDAVVPYWVETSVAQDAKQLCGQTVRRL